VPIDAPTEFVCPRDQSEETKVFIQTCNHFLFVGFSGHDEHVVELLRHIPDASRVVIVSGGDASAILQTLGSSIEALRAGATVELHDRGFANYLESADFERLVSE